jgi:GntR family transcriptional regulator
MAKLLYQFVLDTITENISSGLLGPGAMLPSEIDLGKDLNVSQGTVRKALIELEQRGIVQRRQGRGTFVTVQTPESELFHFFRLRNPDGSQVSPHLEQENINKRNASKIEKELLFGSPDKVFSITRIRSVEGVSIAHETLAVPMNIFPGLMDRGPLPNTLYAFYQHAYACAIVRAEEKLSSCIAGTTVGKALNVKSDTPILKVERIAMDLSDRVVERRISSYVTNGLSYNISLG